MLDLDQAIKKINKTSYSWQSLCARCKHIISFFNLLYNLKPELNVTSIKKFNCIKVFILCQLSTLDIYSRLFVFPVSSVIQKSHEFSHIFIAVVCVLRIKPLIAIFISFLSCFRLGSTCWSNSILELWRFDNATIRALTQNDILDTINNVTVRYGIIDKSLK